MPTEYELDYAVKLETDSRHKNLYKWSIQEFDEESKQVGPDYIPFGWGVNFYASELRLSETVAIETKSTPAGDKEETEIRSRHTIRAELRTGYPQQDAWSAPRLSFFARKGPIENLTLFIMAAEEDEPTGCALAGGLPFTSGGERFGGLLEIRFVVDQPTYDDMVNRIRERSVDVLNLRLARVAGLYSEWSPDIDVRNLKLLTKPENHRLNLSGAGEIEPRTMGVVKEAVLTLNSLQTFHTAKPETEEDEPVPNYGVAVSASPQPAMPKIETKEITERLKQICWFLAGIFLILLAMLFR